jgi:hypothetical protein
MMKSILMILVVGMLSACVSGRKPPETYIDQSGKATVIESDAEMCKRSCNEDYSSCMDTHAASTNEGANLPSGMFGASGQCRTSLQSCLRTCK